MSDKKGQMDLGGDIGKAIFGLAEIALLKVWDLIVFILEYLFKKFFSINSKTFLRKIERKDLECRKASTQENALGYSVTRKRALFVDELNKRRHTLICGATGFGKSVLINTLMLDDLEKKKPVIFIDPKGDNESLEQFIALCQLTGRSFKVFNEYYNGSGSVHLNPTKDGSFTHIADRIHASFNWSDEHYETLCYSALKTACANLIERNQSVSYKAIFDELLTLSSPEKGKRGLNRKDIQGIITRLENIIQSDFGPRLDKDGLSMREVWKSKECIYIALPVLGYPKIARALGRLLLGDLAFAVYDAYKNATVSNKGRFWPVGVYIDELSAVITDEFIELLNKCRGAGMELNIAFQSPSDINKINPHLCEQILENTSNWFILKQRMECGSNIFAEAMGTTRSVKQTIRVKDGQEQAQGSQRDVEELLAHHNIIKNLNEGQAVLLRHAPTQIDLVNIKYICPEGLHNDLEMLKEEGWIEKIETPQSQEIVVEDEAL